MNNNNTTGRYVIGTNNLWSPRDGMEIKNAFDNNGLIEDWNAIEKLWDHAFLSLRLDSKEQPLLLTEPQFQSQGKQRKID